MKKHHTITVSILLENSLWIGLFERKDNETYAAAREIFGKEPTDAELYQFVSLHFNKLKFTEPQDFKLIIKRKNPKRMKREVKKEMERAKKGLSSATHAQETLRLELEKNKKLKKKISRSAKEALEERKFQLKQNKRKKKHKGH